MPMNKNQINHKSSQSSRGESSGVFMRKLNSDYYIEVLLSVDVFVFRNKAL